jgi:hypothetical protein
MPDTTLRIETNQTALVETQVEAIRETKFASFTHPRKEICGTRKLAQIGVLRHNAS